MSELGLKNTAKYKKSARTVGDVLGKFHPHGEQACYEAMVIMAQSFSYRYPLVDGQGNWGSTDDPKSFAAMRYTESRLSAYADLLLSELEQGTVDWAPNFDGSLEEPTLLPARLPNILLNGTTGIAVGMATDIPPHNLREITAGCIRLLEEPNTTLDQLCEHIQGPDFPTQAEIISSRNDIKELYRQGTGSLRMRAVFIREDENIIITALPHQVSGAKILEQIASQIREKKLPMVEDLRDESDHENPTRLVIVLRSNRVDAEALMAHLFATTDLERTYRVNLNVIGIDGKPQVKNLLTLLKEWLIYRVNTVRKRLQYRLDKVCSRLHILDGLLIAYLNIDEVIRIIRHEDEPKQVLMTRFKLSDLQAEAILELKLRHLARLEEMQIRGEQKELATEQAKLEKLLSSEQNIKKLIRDELIADAEKYGDTRMSPIIARAEAQAMRETELLPSEPVTIILSQMGWVRAAKGHNIDAENLNYKAGDAFKAAACGKSNQAAIFFDSHGRTYTLPTHTLPSARGQGEPLTGRINPPPGATFEGIILAEPEQHVLLASNAGYGFVVSVSELISKNKNGKSILKLASNTKALTPSLVNNLASDYIAAVTNSGNLLVFALKELPILPRGKGNKIINIPTAKFSSGEEFVVNVAALTPNQSLVLYSGSRHFTLKPNDLQNYLSERGKRGNKLPRGYQRIDKVSAKD